MSAPVVPDLATLKQALAIAEQIENLESQLRSILNGSSKPEPVAREIAPAPAKARKKKRVVSAESRAKMAAAQRARWAKRNASAAAGGG